MALLRIQGVDGTELGSINWFAVHPTSMNNTNTLISGDNKGYASMLFEAEKNPNSRPGRGSFVAAFGSANLGDVSPNTEGPKCIDTGESCENESSTCCDKDGNNCYVQKCIAFGPGKDQKGDPDMQESTRIIGERQFQKAKELYDQAAALNDLIKGPVQYKHQFVNMPEYEVKSLQAQACIKVLNPSFHYR